VSEQKHAPEPWRVLHDETYPRVIFISSDGGPFVSGDVEEPDALRIVACVNSLAGVEDPQSAIEKARAALQRAIIVGGLTYITQMELEAALAALTPTNTP
jgi:hypothetical protein